MRSKTPGVLMAVVAGLLLAGCQQPQAPLNEKQARLLAAENTDLRQQLKARQTEIEVLRRKQSDELRRRDEELTQCKARIEVLQREVEKNVAERVQGVTTTVMDENAKLRQEITDLKAQLAKLKATTPPAGS